MEAHLFIKVITRYYYVDVDLVEGAWQQNGQDSSRTKIVAEPFLAVGADS